MMMFDVAAIVAVVVAAAAVRIYVRKDEAAKESRER
jgi:hypothetical protein